MQNMIDFTPVEGDAERWLRQSVRVYLEGDNNFHWISRVCARFGEPDSDIASHNVWQIQPDAPLTEIAEECEGVS
jgi:hypothetical protein